MTAQNLRLRFVSTSGSNFFMTELLELVAAGARDLGADAQVVLDRFPSGDPDTVFVMIPHEFYATTPETDHPTVDQLARTVAFCTEQPGAWWFDQTVPRLAGMGAVMDLQAMGVAELRRQGVRAEHLPLGYHPSWDGWGRDPARERPLDVLFLGSADRRRDQLLASYAPSLWARRTHTRFATDEAKPHAAPGLLLGEEKRRVIGSAQIMLAPRRAPRPYFEWARALDAVLNGAVVLSEHAAGFAPLVPGEHFVSGAAPSLGLLAAELLEDPARLDAIRFAAYDLVRDSLPMTVGAERLLGVATDLAARTPAVREPAPAPATGPSEPPTVPALPAPAWTRLIVNPAPEPPLPVSDDDAEIRTRLKTLLLEQVVERRARATGEARAAGVEDPLATIETAVTPAYAGATPRVSVLIPSYDHASDVADALASVAASDYADLEVLVHDDASTDDTQTVLRAFLAARPWLPARVTTAAVNAGLPHSRNRLAAASRGELLLILDADNELWPTAIGRLVDALDGDPAADFAYPILQMHRDGEPQGLLSYSTWDPAILPQRNPVDALSLIRRERLLALGGYTEDVRMLGWEDYDLWCRVAAAGGHGVQVPEILARYRVGDKSMLSLTDIDVSAMRALLRVRYPTVMGLNPYP